MWMCGQRYVDVHQPHLATDYFRSMEVRIWEWSCAYVQFVNTVCSFISLLLLVCLPLISVCMLASCFYIYASYFQMHVCLLLLSLFVSYFYKSVCFYFYVCICCFYFYVYICCCCCFYVYVCCLCVHVYICCFYFYVYICCFYFCLYICCFCFYVHICFLFLSIYLLFIAIFTFASFLAMLAPGFVWILFYLYTENARTYHYFLFFSLLRKRLCQRIEKLCLFTCIKKNPCFQMETDSSTQWQGAFLQMNRTKWSSKMDGCQLLQTSDI